MSDTTTNGIRVQVETRYLPEQSSPRDNQYLFAYRIRISNEGGETAQLISRHWVITDADGHVEQVQGPGVVGEQPVLGPGSSFEYTELLPAPDVSRDDAGDLPDGEGERRRVRRGHRTVHAGNAERPELKTSRQSSSSLTPASAAPGPAAGRTPGSRSSSTPRSPCRRCVRTMHMPQKSTCLPVASMPSV